MADHVTLLRPEAQSGSSSASLSLPADLLAQVRGRVRILAILLLVAFGSDLVIAGIIVAGAILGGPPLPADWALQARTLIGSAVASLASIGMWWAAGGSRVEPSRLLTLGLVYEALMCFIIALITFWQFYRANGVLPNLTWVPVVVILFPMIIPGPPKRILVGAIVSAATAPAALLLLDAIGQLSLNGDAVVSTVVASAFAVGFAYMGARTIYGLGKAVAAARQLGSYRLEERLGHGGMGDVWRARHRLLARPAAIKVIRQSPGGGAGEISVEVTRRFEREAQTIAGLRSPHTVELFDFGVADDGTFYYAMELLDGLDTDTLVRRYGPLPAERVVFILRQVCHSLSEAHGRGLVHRDIKPANVFLCRYGEECDFVKVLDFGIVKGRDDRAVDDPALTRENVFHGTPAFVAPEQAEGHAAIDGRADLYATGCLGYWLLTGGIVFPAETPMAMLAHHLRTTPPPPSSRTELPVPEKLDQIVLACLAKDPGDRPATARALARELEGVVTATPWSSERADTWWTTHQPGTG